MRKSRSTDPHLVVELMYTMMAIHRAASDLDTIDKCRVFVLS